MSKPWEEDEVVGEAPWDQDQLVEEMSHKVYGFMGKDPNANYSAGVPDWNFRAGLSTRNNEAEKLTYLNSTVGEDGWYYDKGGELMLNAKGLNRLGIDSVEPRAVDEWYPSRYDIADMQGDAPEVSGGLIGAMVGGPYGALATAGMTALGSMAGAGYQEIADIWGGTNEESTGEVSERMGNTGLLAMLGEGLQQRVFNPIGRHLMGPNRNKVNPALMQTAEEARSIGVNPSFDQVVPGTLPGRAMNITEYIFGNPRGAPNSMAFRRELNDMLNTMSPNTPDHINLGKNIAQGVRDSRKTFGQEASAKYKVVTDIMGEDAPIVPTQSLKSRAEDLFKDLPKDAETGAPVFTDPNTTTFVRQVKSLEDSVSIPQMQAIRERLFQAIHGDDLIPGISSHQARQLFKASTKSFDDIGEFTPTRKSSIIGPDGNPVEVEVPIQSSEAIQIKEALTRANDFYKKGISDFDDDLIAKMAKTSGRGKIDPEFVVEQLFQPKKISRFNRISKHLDPEVLGEVKRSAMETLTDHAMKVNPKDPAEELFSGKAFLRTLDRYGRSHLNRAFGTETTNRMYKFGRVARMINEGKKAEGVLIASSLAARPMKNLGRVTWYRILHKVFNDETTFKWLTKGLDADNTRAASDLVSRMTLLTSTLGDDELQQD